MNTLNNQVIRGYELHENIGTGGFGAVYRAYQSVIGREVAVKVILPQYANQPDFIRRFETEAQLVARLEHPHIVPLFDYWRDPSGAYLVLRLLRGGSLHALMEKGALELPLIVRIIDQIASALMVAHRNGVIHRDIKPQNILLDEDLNAYLTDFGIAKVMGDPLTDDDEGISGSPAYLAPEQIKSDPVTAQTDIYGLGVILFELLAGIHPFPGDTMSELIFHHLQDPLPHLEQYRPDLPDTINRVIQKATAKEPDDRYTDTLALAEDFRRAALNEATIEPTEEVDFTNLINPYKGLRAFEEADATDFFGREVMIQHLVARLAETEEFARFLAVVGPSGSGKSSVIKAGVIPALRWGDIPDSATWFIVEMTPGNQPIQRLGEALTSVAVNQTPHLMDQLRSDKRGLLWGIDMIGLGSELLLVIDQFEEIFTLTQDENERSHFLDLLHTAVTSPDSRVRIVITLRADFMDRPLQYPLFGELLRKRTEFILPLSPDEIERAVTGPAQRVGLQVDSNLLAAIVSDVRAEPGALPLLQYALTEVFERHDGRYLTLEAYQNSGGILGALARRAEELYKEMPATQQAITRQLFLRLITLGEGTEDTRRRVHRSELIAVANPDIVQTILDAFSKYRLLSFDHDPITREPTIEIAHEALIREWEQLKTWLDHSRDDLRQQRQLNTAASEWIKNNRDTSFVLRGSRLSTLEDWANSTDLILTPEERAYLQASIKEREREKTEAQAQIEREQRLKRRADTILRSLVAVLLFGIIISLGLTAVAVNRGQEAEAAQKTSVLNEQLAINNAATATYAQGQAVIEANNAQTQVAIASTALADVERGALEAHSIALAAVAAQALGSDNTDLSLALALEANRIPNPPSRVRYTLAQAAYAAGTHRVYTSSNEWLTGLAVNPNGETFLTSDRTGLVTEWDIESGEKLRTQQFDTWVNDLNFSPDGQSVLVALLDNTVMLWDVTRWTEIRTLTGHQDQVYAVAFSPNGKMAISGPGGTMSTVKNNDVILWDLTSGNEIHRLSGHNDEVQNVAFSPDGTIAASASGDDFQETGDNVIILWDVETGEEIRRLQADTGRPNSIAFSPDGQTLAAGYYNEFIVLWNVQKGEEIRRLEGHVGAIETIAFSTDGQFIVSGSQDFSLRLWEVATGKQLRRFLGHTAPITHVRFTPDDRQIISISSDGTARLWYTNGSTELSRFVDDDPVRTVALSPDGTQVMSGSLTGRLILWDAATGEKIRNFEGHKDTILSIAFHPTDPTALVSDYAGGLILWNLETGEQVTQLEGYSTSHIIPAVAFSSDGNLAVSIGINPFTITPPSEVILWNMDTGQQLWRTELSFEVVTSLAFSRDNQTILLGSGNSNNNGAGELVIFDTATGTEQQRSIGHAESIYIVAVSPDGQRALTAAGDRTIVLWDLATGQELYRFIGHTDIIQGVDFSPDGKTALSASWDKTVRLWNIETGEEILRYDGHTDRARSVVFSPDGQTAFSAGWDGTIRQWLMPLSGEELIAWALENRYVRDFTCAERQQYSIEPLCDGTQ